jgi:glycine hydroxymethyltransferase
MANVQPHSGAQANQTVFFAALKPGDTVLGMSLPHGGHLTHGSPVNQSGKWFHVVAYGLDPESELIDYDAAERLAHEHKPKLVIAGASAYSRVIDWKRFKQIADGVGAKLMVDMAHYAGLVAAGVYPSPIPHADYVTTTTHKTLRGPRGGLVLAARITRSRSTRRCSRACRADPLMHVIAAKAVALGEALQPEFKAYQRQVIDNARVLATVLRDRGLRIVSGGTDSHMFLVDLRPKKLTGKDAEAALARAHITVNKNAIPNDPEKPFVTSGIRLGSPAVTTRGFTEIECEELGHLVADVLDKPHDDPTAARVKAGIAVLTSKFQVYG